MRNSFRFGVVVTTVTSFAVLAAAPALATSPKPSDTAFNAGPGLTAAETLGLFVGIPLLVIGLVYLLVYAATSRKGPKYPATAPWEGPAVWFGAPDQPERELEQAAPATGGGGARGQW